MQWFTDKESLMLLLEILVLTLLAGLSMPLWPPMGAVFGFAFGIVGHMLTA